jgi:O-antigen ligase
LTDPAPSGGWQTLESVAETLFLVSLVLAPWPYGSAGDAARYALSALLLVGAALWFLGRAGLRQGIPGTALVAAVLPGLGLVQWALGRSAAPVWTAETVLVLTGMLSAMSFWIERGRDYGAARRLAFAVLLVCGLEGLFGAVQWSLGSDRIYGETHLGVSSPFGSFVNHNHFAGLLEMGALLAAGIAMGAARGARLVSSRAISFAGVALGLATAHLASRSRGGLVALAGGALLFALPPLSGAFGWRTGRKHSWLRAALFLVAILGFGLAVIPATTREYLGTIVNGPVDFSGEYRIDMAKASLRLAAAHPWVGCGLGAYADAIPPFKHGYGYTRTTHAESDVLEFLSEGGLLGLATLVLLAMSVLGGLGDRMTHGRDAFRKGIAAGAGAAAGALLVHSFFDFNLHIPANALVFGSLLGLAGSPRSSRVSPGGRWAPAGMAFVLLGLALACAWRADGALAIERALGTEDLGLRAENIGRVLAHHPYLANAFRERGLALRELGLASPAFREARLVKAEHDLQRAVRLRPRWGEAWADLGWVKALRGEGKEADTDLAYAVALDPTHPGISVARAQLFAETGRLQAAIDELVRLRRTDPSIRAEWCLSFAARWTSDRSALEALSDGAAPNRAAKPILGPAPELPEH